jgi:DNA polymerase
MGRVMAMDRNEAVLRELNLYPQWVRREQPADEFRGTARRADADADAGTESSCAPAENMAASAADVQPSAMGIAQPVLSADEGLKPSYESAPAEGRLGGGVADTQQSMPVIAQPVSDADEASGAVPDKVVAEPESVAAVAGDESGREQLIARLGWPELKSMVRDCTACKLRAGCTQTVFGVGDQQADWLFVGEGPGADEDARGEPFVGQAGKLLDSMLLALKLKRGDNVYIANIVKCRPPVESSGKQSPPDKDAIETCLPYLRRQIQLIQPKVIVALGKTAATALLNTGDVALGSLRGTVQDFDGIPLIVTYHPAYLLRSPMEKAKAWQDLCLARQTLQNT